MITSTWIDGLIFNILGTYLVSSPFCSGVGGSPPDENCFGGVAVFAMGLSAVLADNIFPFEIT